MKKRILTVLLAVVVLIAALPMGFLVSADKSEVSDKDAASDVAIVVNGKVDANSFPVKAGTYNAGWADTSDPGLKNSMIHYVQTEGDLKVSYDRESTGVKFKGVSPAYSADPNAARFFLKNVPSISTGLESNAIGFHFDGTALNTEAEYMNVRVAINFVKLPSIGSRVALPGQKYYFLSDEEDAVLEEMTIIADGEDGYAQLKRGVSGFYFFPNEAFGEWAGFACDALQTSWIMDGNNWSNTYFQFSRFDDLADGETFIVDDVCYASIGEPLPPRFLPIKTAENSVIQDFNTDDVAKVTGGDNNHSQIFPTISKLIEGDNDKAVYVKGVAGNTTYTSITPAPNGKVFAETAAGISFHIDTTGADADSTVRLSFGVGGKGFTIWAGLPFYYLEDGKEEGEYEEGVFTGSDRWSTWFSIKAGRSGTYFIPFSSFVTPNTKVVNAEGKLDESVYDKALDPKEYAGELVTGISIQNNGAVLYVIDDISFCSVDGATAIPEKEPFKYYNASIIQDFEGWNKTTDVDVVNGTGKVSTWPNADTDGDEDKDWDDDYPKFSIVKSPSSTGGEKALNINRGSGSNYAVVNMNSDNSKYVPDATALSFYVDSTAETRNTNMRISFTVGDAGAFTWFGGRYYFLPDGKNPQDYETYLISGKDQWSSWVTIQGGRKGTYIIPLESFEVPENVPGTVSDSAKRFKAENYHSKSIDKISLQIQDSSDASFIFDTFAWTSADGKWNIPPQDPLPYMFAGEFIDFQLEADLIGGKTFGGWGTIDPSSHFSFGEDNKLVINLPKSYTSADTAMAFAATEKVPDGSLAFAMTVDASKVGSDMSIRGSLGGGKGYRNTGGTATYYLVPEKGDYVEKSFGGERFTIPAGFVGTVVIPFEGFAGGGSEIPVAPTAKDLQQLPKLSLSWYVYDVTTTNNTLIMSKFNFMKKNDGSNPETGVEDYTVAVFGLLLAAAFVGGVAVKKGLCK